tara:strand:+ start:145 stop:555 length:411 start_codon:yes stop_codon:yes gene_type:complete
MSEMMIAVEIIAKADVVALEKAEKSYGDSWKKRGGVGSFMMLARKWDRLEKQVENMDYDVFEAIRDDNREEGVIDDVRDLRRYLMLVEAEILRTAELDAKKLRAVHSVQLRDDFDENKELFLECGDEWKRDSVRQT